MSSNGKLVAKQQDEFNQDICDVWAACSIPWNELSNPAFQSFVHKWIPEASVPNRQTISDEVLPKRVSEVEAFHKKACQGKLAMGQCDGWKNVARDPIIAMMMTVEDQVHILRTHHVGAARKTAENLLMLIKTNIQEARDNYGVEWVGWCTDGSSESKKARRLLFNEMPETINPDCAAHQINLLVADYFKIKEDFVSQASKAQDIIKWFNNHSRALEWLREEQKHTMQKILALLYPILTRWTSVYMALKRLLDCMPAFRALMLTHTRQDFCEIAGTDRKARERAVRIYDLINDGNFWADISRITFHLEPLTIAAHITEGRVTRLDQVLLTLGNLFYIYSKMVGRDASVGAAMCASILARWSGMDQDIFILAVYLNPYIRGDLFNKQHISGDFLCSGITVLVLRVWKRLYGQSTDPDPDFMRACSDYYNRNPASIFSDSSMNLAMRERIAHSEGREVDVLKIWQELDDTTYHGRNWIVKLGIRVFSVVANSAASERVFSQMGRTHNKYRSRLSLDSVRNTVVLRNTVLHAYEDEKARISSLKRKEREFDADNTQESAQKRCIDAGFIEHEEDHEYTAEYEEIVSSESNGIFYDSEGFFAELSRRLIEDLNEDTMATAEFEGPLPEGSDVGALFRTGTFGRPARITIAEIFNFTASVSLPIEDKQAFGGSTDGQASRAQARGVDMYWKAGMRDLQAGLQSLARLQSTCTAIDSAST
ncbi:hAT family dimerization protein [Ceratobasidium sp. AG-Ba]|nr:hAT family dimerization protein [Ceratobasidium sp. AG-Ba]